MARVSFPSFEKLIAAAAEVAGRFGHGAALGGGLAMQFHGSPRLTADVDLVASRLPIDALDWPALDWPEALTFGGVRGIASNGVPVDVIVRIDEWADLYLDALGEARFVDGSPIPVLTPEWLVPIKMVAGRPKDESDVLFLLGTSGVMVGATESIVRKHLGAFGVSEFKSLVKEAAWLRERER